MIEKNCKKYQKKFHCTFPFNFGKINIDIKIPFPRPHENNQEIIISIYFSQITLYSLYCGGPCMAF